MPEHVKHVPKHRQPAARRAPRQAVRTLVVLSSLAVAGTATAVAGGALSLDAAPQGLATPRRATPERVRNGPGPPRPGHVLHARNKLYTRSRHRD